MVPQLASGCPIHHGYEVVSMLRPREEYGQVQVGNHSGHAFEQYVEAFATIYETEDENDTGLRPIP